MHQEQCGCAPVFSPPTLKLPNCFQQYGVTWKIFRPASGWGHSTRPAEGSVFQNPLSVQRHMIPSLGSCKGPAVTEFRHYYVEPYRDGRPLGQYTSWADSPERSTTIIKRYTPPPITSHQIWAGHEPNFTTRPRGGVWAHREAVPVVATRAATRCRDRGSPGH